MLGLLKEDRKCGVSMPNVTAESATSRCTGILAAAECHADAVDIPPTHTDSLAHLRPASSLMPPTAGHDVCGIQAEIGERIHRRRVDPTVLAESSVASWERGAHRINPEGDDRHCRRREFRNRAHPAAHPLPVGAGRAGRAAMAAPVAGGVAGGEAPRGAGWRLMYRDRA